MKRSDLVLAAAGGLLLAAAFVSGLAAAGARDDWRGTHAKVAPAALAGVSAFHAIALGRLAATARRARAVAKGLGLPDWLAAQAARNRRRATPFVAGGTAAILLAALSGSARGPWHAAASSFAVGFNAVAFLIESAAVVAHRRLLAEMNGQAAGAREGRGEPEPAPEAFA